MYSQDIQSRSLECHTNNNPFDLFLFRNNSKQASSCRNSSTKRMVITPSNFRMSYQTLHCTNRRSYDSAIVGHQVEPPISFPTIRHLLHKLTWCPGQKKLPSKHNFFYGAKLSHNKPNRGPLDSFKIGDESNFV